MQPISDFNSNLSKAIVLIGPPGTGKTTLGCRLFTNIYAIVTDLNFDSGLRWLKQNNLQNNVIGFDTPMREPDGKILSFPQAYDKMFRCLNEQTKNPDVGCILVDSLTHTADIVMGKQTGAANAANLKWEVGSAAMYMSAWKSLIYELRLSGKPIVVVAHEKMEKDEMSGVIQYEINLWGQLRDRLGDLMSDVWRCEIVPPKLPTDKHTWQVRTLGDIRHAKLKNSFGLPAVMSQDTVIKAVRV